MTTQQAIKESKLLRYELDIHLQELKGSEQQGRERSLAITKLQEAIMWLGMDLKAMADGESCYSHGYDSSSTEVEPTADGVKL